MALYAKRMIVVFLINLKSLFPSPFVRIVEDPLFVFKNLGFIFACLVLLTSCAADDDRQGVMTAPHPATNSKPIPIKLSIGQASLTRAADGLNQGKLPAGSNVTVVIDGKEYTFQTNADNAELTCVSDPVPYYPLDGSSVKIKAYYPAYSGWYNRTTEWNGGMSFDQSTDANYRISDRMQGTVSSSFLDTNGKVISTQNAVPITFKHLMAKVVLKITQPNDGTKITKVTLNSVKGRYKMCNGEYVANSAYFADNNTAGNYTLYTNTAGATGTVVCAGLFPPQTISKDVNFITVTTNENTIYYKLPQDHTFEAGKSYEFSLSSYVDKTSFVIGNVICSDGSMMPYKSIGNRTPVAIIVYVGPNTGNANYKHGLALSFKTVGCRLSNRDGGVLLSHPVNMTTSGNVLDINPPVEDGSVYMDTQHIRRDGTYGAWWPPFFHVNDKNPTVPSSNTSGWFLPSAYQWKQVMQAMGKSATDINKKFRSLVSSQGIPTTVAKDYDASSFWTCTQSGNTSFNYLELSSSTCRFGQTSVFNTNVRCSVGMLAF